MTKTSFTTILAALLPLALVACAKSEVPDRWHPSGERFPADEVCDGLDNDLDGLVDEDYRNDAGAYQHDEHCGECGAACVEDDVTLDAQCLNGDSGPFCGAAICISGYVVTDTFDCVDWGGWLCKPCIEDAECGGFPGARCLDVEGEPRCVVECIDGDCPNSFGCSDEGICLPPSGSCQCAAGDYFTMFCEIEIEDSEELCLGTAICDDAVLSECEGSEEICDGVDNDCNGTVDDPYVNEYGGYGVDLHNCGGCGIDCTDNPIAEDELICGGPPTDPVCAMLCADALDGIDVGDEIDADLQLANGCECVVQSLSDPAGPLLASGSDLDTNCDGAEGIVVESYYVSPDGDDAGPGSPGNPLGSINAAVEAAFESLETDTPRPHVFVSVGSYAEVLELREGVLIHGGYAPDFLTYDPVSYVTEVHPPSWDAAPGGAALVADGVGLAAETLVEGIYFTGASAPEPGLPAYGAYLRNSGGELRVEGCLIQAGDGIDGADGSDGAAGAAPPPADDGELPRGAEESSSHECLDTAANVVAGGEGTPFSCSSIDVSGGDGGDSTCPGDIGSIQVGGGDGEGTSFANPGDGGSGGYDANGPRYEPYCPGGICCGLADFLVPYEYEVAGDGEPGNPGPDGDPGNGCDDPFGAIEDGDWTGDSASGGSGGGPGSGGGGGGAGGGARIEWESSYCEFADGLGGGGGGGGAGGCGGSGGLPGTSGSPTIGVVVIFEGSGPFPDEAPVLQAIAISTGQGGEGGRGGGGGAGGLGGAGGSGGELEPEDKTTPTLAGPASGGHGGAGGVGGSGGGGGGGCGGASVGIWLDTGPASYPGIGGSYQSANDFVLGAAGPGGEGGGGSSAGGDGEAGEEVEVHEN